MLRDINVALCSFNVAKVNHYIRLRRYDLDITTGAQHSIELAQGYVWRRAMLKNV